MTSHYQDNTPTLKALVSRARECGAHHIRLHGINKDDFIHGCIHTHNSRPAVLSWTNQQGKCSHEASDLEAQNRLLADCQISLKIEENWVTIL